MGDVVGGVLGIVGSVLGGRQATKAAKAAGSVQQEAAFAAIEETKRQFDVTQESFAPFLAAGGRALTQQEALLGLSGQEAQQGAFAAFTESPGQKFLRERGERALLRGASATGGLGGGNVRSALQQQGIGFAQQQLNQQLAQLAGISGTGQQTAVAQGQFGAQAAGQIGSLLQAGGEARASGILGAQQARGQTLQSIFGSLGGIAGSFG